MNEIVYNAEPHHGIVLLWLTLLGAMIAAVVNQIRYDKAKVEIEEWKAEASDLLTKVNEAIGEKVSAERELQRERERWRLPVAKTGRTT